MSTNLDLQPVAEVHCGRLRWHIPHDNYSVPLKFINNDTHLLYDQDAVDAAVAAERERCARVFDDEARIRTEAGNTHPEDSDSRGRCFAAARAAINCAKGVRGGEVVGPNVGVEPHSAAGKDVT